MTTPPSSRYPRVAWAFVGWLLAVILFGAWVRITHSGAGCGRHWPLCNGEIIPPSPTVETMIEFGHRVTSGLCGPWSLLLVGWAARLYGARHKVTVLAAVTLFFVLVEGAIGAGLVLGELVESDDSVARAVVISLHLTNTLMLMGTATAAAWFSGEGWGWSWKKPALAAAWTLALGAFVGTAMSGAVTALGDTLFPVGSEAARQAADHFLVQLRIIHPFVALTVGLGLIGFAWRLREAGTAVRWATALGGLTIAQLLVGPLNIALKAPGWMQLVHLGVAQALWVAFVVTFLAASRR